MDKDEDEDKETCKRCKFLSEKLVEKEDKMGIYIAEVRKPTKC